MKKNIFRVIALLLVAGMMFTFCSCKQEVLIRFVDENGNDLDLSAIGSGNGNGGSNDPAPVEDSTAPQADSTAPQADSTAPQADSTAPQADSTAPAETPTTPAAPQGNTTGGVPSTTAEIVAFYKSAVDKIKNNAEGGYTKKEWQVLEEINIGPSIVNNAVKSLAGNFMTTEDKAEAQVSAKGSDDAKGRFPGFTLTDMSKIASATCTANGNNYNIKIVMADEDTPKKTGSFLGQVTNSLLYWEDIDDTLKNDGTVNKVIKSYDGIHVIYKGFVIEAVISSDGKFQSLNHTANVDIIIGSAKLVVGSIENKNGHLVNYCKYTDFNY